MHATYDQFCCTTFGNMALQNTMLEIIAWSVLIWLFFFFSCPSNELWNGVLWNGVRLIEAALQGNWSVSIIPVYYHNLSLLIASLVEWLECPRLVTGPGPKCSLKITRSGTQASSVYHSGAYYRRQDYFGRFPDCDNNVCASWNPRHTFTEDRRGRVANSLRHCL